ncbi:MAG TPA: hypothetical protein VLD19_08090 [Chitinophagaceae bacterium]|nr:hypothetical protein [Chitinophagaceae bacterium]
MKKALLTLLLGGWLFAGYAQDDSSAVSEPPAKSYGKLSVSYLTNSVFNGRKDSLLTPYITPTIGYYDKSGFFADGAMSYLARAGSDGVDLVTVEAGYDFSINKFDGEIMGSKFFYNSSSTNTKSEISGSLAASAAYDFGFIHPTLQGSLNFGKNTDYAVSFSLDHAFYAAGDNLVITPSLLMNASTQNYYGSYYNNRKYAKLRKKVYYDITADVSDASRFKLLDYECSVPIEYTVKKFTFSFIPAFAIPVNPAVVTVNIKASATSATVSKTVTEKTDNSFFATFEVSFKF